ncbi:MAG: hypothetical protein WDZ51_02205 [Pirellulaceae bacterium]
MPNHESPDHPYDLYLKLHWRSRLCVTVAVLAVAILLIAPWSGSFHPEGNWLFGPLWLLLVRHPGEKLIGAVIAMVLLPAIGAVLFRPGIITAIVSGPGLMLWVGFGVYLAMLAVV